jgi:hypothetical protein
MPYLPKKKPSKRYNNLVDVDQCETVEGSDYILNEFVSIVNNCKCKLRRLLL